MEQVLGKMRDIIREGGNIVVLATHDEEELDISDKVYIMKQGILCESSKWLRGEELIKEIMT